jgi:transposase-like protein
MSAGLVSQVTNGVLEEVVEWQNSPLDPVYPIVYLDCIVLKIRQDAAVYCPYGAEFTEVCALEGLQKTDC